MRGIHKRLNTGAMVFALACLLGGKPAEAGLIPKVDSFVFFLDQSGSMYMHHESLGEVKMALAKRLLKDMSELIPEWGYKEALCLFAPFEQIQEPEVYLQGNFAAAIGKIKDDQEIFGRPTLMGAGIRSLDQVLSKMTGSTVIFLISDGGASSKHDDPVTETLQLRLKYLQMHLHVISLAEDEAGRARLQEIGGAGNGMVVEGARLLEKGFALEELVNEIFFEDVPEKPSPPTVTPVPGLQGIAFNSGASEIEPEGKALLDEDASILKSYEDSMIVVEGHTDGIGSDDKNQLLSERRAKAVRDYFILKEIPQDRMKIMGYGSLRPIDTNETTAGRARNRRVEIKVVK